MNAFQIFKQAGVDITKLSNGDDINWNNIGQEALKWGAGGAAVGGGLEAILGQGKPHESGKDKIKRILYSALTGGGLGAVTGGGISAGGQLMNGGKVPEPSPQEVL